MNPFSEYLRKADCVLKYLTHMQKYTIKYSLRDNNKSSFIAISDASFTDNSVTRKST